MRADPSWKHNPSADSAQKRYSSARISVPSPVYHAMRSACGRLGCHVWPVSLPRCWKLPPSHRRPSPKPSPILRRFLAAHDEKARRVRLSCPPVAFAHAVGCTTLWSRRDPPVFLGGAADADNSPCLRILSFSTAFHDILCAPGIHPVPFESLLIGPPSSRLAA